MSTDPIDNAQPLADPADPSVSVPTSSTTAASSSAIAVNRNRQLAQTLMAMLEPVLASAHYELVDLVVAGVGSIDATVQVLVDHAFDHPLGGRIDLDGVSAVTRLVNETIDAADPIDEAYTLEVSSPGLERPLRTPAHFRRFLGTQIAVRLLPGVAGERRVEGRLMLADDHPDGAITVNGRAIPYADIERARTVFVWGPQPKRGPGAPGLSKTAAKKAAKAAALAAAAASAGDSGDDRQGADSASVESDRGDRASVGHVEDEDLDDEDVDDEELDGGFDDDDFEDESEFDDDDEDDDFEDDDFDDDEGEGDDDDDAS